MKRRPLWAGAAVAALVWSAIGVTSAAAAVTQGVPAPYVTTDNSSDPHAKPCTHDGQAGICVFASQDLNEGAVTADYPNGQANSYPMVSTRGYFSTDGISWQGPWELMNESRYRQAGWVPTSTRLPNGPKHLWAPSAQQSGDGNWYLYVPDISVTAQPATSSFIGVSRSTTGDPMGPYEPVAKVNINGYASDPDVVDTMSGRFGTGPYLAWADGDGSNCGGISIAPLDGFSMTTITSDPTRPVFDGVPSSFGSPCTDRFGRTHFYMEGPHIYNTSLGGWPAGVPGPYLMAVPIKPTTTPPECVLNVQGQPGSSNELVAWATANSPLGTLSPADGKYHWSYGGVLMCGSKSDFTIQGSIVPVTTSGRTGGKSPLLFVYHDGLGGTSSGHHRTLHAECLFYGNNSLAGSIRTAGSSFLDSGAEHDCLLGPPQPNFALKAANGRFLSQNGNNVLTANRFGVGPWEQFNLFDSSGATISTTAGGTFNSGKWDPVAGNWVTAPSATAQLTSTGGSGNPILFNFTCAGGSVVISSVTTGLGVQTLSDNTLRANTRFAESYRIYHQ